MSIKAFWCDKNGSHREGTLSDQTIDKINELKDKLNLSELDILTIAIHEYHKDIIQKKEMENEKL